jgi:N6-adenosine-specific RNA methylase IME4
LVKPLDEFVLAFSTTPNKRTFPLLTESQVQHVFAPKPRRGEHSRKPAVIRDLIVELLGDRPKIELFARERVPGWDGWGDEYPR